MQVDTAFHDLPNPVKINFEISDALRADQRRGFLWFCIPCRVSFPKGIVKMGEISLEIESSSFLEMFFEGSKPWNKAGKGGNSPLWSIPRANSVKSPRLRWEEEVGPEGLSSPPLLPDRLGFIAEFQRETRLQVSFLGKKSGNPEQNGFSKRCRKSDQVRDSNPLRERSEGEYIAGVTTAFGERFP